jgi:flagellar biosynthesis GTPase FlhF
MGETTADTRHEIERTRAELGDTLTALRSRTVVVGGKVIRVAIIAAGVLAAAGSTAAVLVIVRRRRGGSVVRAARRLPEVTHVAALPAARASERWMTRRAERAREQREQLVEAMTAKIAENQAQADRRANPLWRRTAAKTLETAASVGVAALIRRAMSEPMSRGPKLPLSAPEKELLGGRMKQDPASAPSGTEAEATASH